MSYTVCITGGTGSFGQAMTRLLLNSSDWKVRVLSRSEYPQVEMKKNFNDSRVTFMLGDVCDIDRLRMAFDGCDLVLHAAALKHVPVGESNPDEVVRVNIDGSRNVVRAARDCHVNQAILISSDKAVHPINLYGSTKLTAEKLFINGNSYTQQTRLNVCRYGNVMGSRGSVSEIWQYMIARGLPLGLTDMNMTRFWFSMVDALRFVLWCAAENQKGVIFVPHMPAFDMYDLMHAMLAKTTLVINQDYVLMGMRPGEKMHEYILTEHEVAASRTFLHADDETVQVLDSGEQVVRGSVYAHAVFPANTDWEIVPYDPERWRDLRDHLGATDSQKWPWRLSIDHILARLKQL